MVLYNFKAITVVPTSKDFVDIVLSKTQRKTPTVVHPNYEIGRIRNFYLRKVKFAGQSFHDRLTQILDEFPTLDDIHPFYADLMNVLYDRDHYKLALGQLNTARSLVDNVNKDYAKLMKYGDSLFRCKQLKKAALGRMCTIMKKQQASLTYLEQVRQHLARLPSIDPNTRTLIVCGYPNVGKSSFLNKVTRAHVDVQPYAFTTKSLFVGHTDYEYLPWQVIDTPGILDHPLEERNTIEMQSITALAHLRAAIIYIIDISEQCGYNIKQQVALFHSIKALFTNKPVLVVLNKTDITKVEELNEEERKMVQSLAVDGAEVVTMSTLTDDGVSVVKQTACEKLLAQRVEAKLKGKKVADSLNRLHVAQPQARDGKQRPAFIPPSVLAMREAKMNGEMAQVEGVEETPAEETPFWLRGFGTLEWKRRYQLKNPDWRFDAVPEIIDGHNIADFIDPDILERLEELEREEEELMRNAENQMDEDEYELDEEQTETVKKIKQKKLSLMQQSRLNRRIKTYKPRKYEKEDNMNPEAMGASLQEMGLDPEKAVRRARSESRQPRKRTRSSSTADMDTEMDPRELKKQQREASLTPKPGEGYKDFKHKEKALKVAKKAIIKLTKNSAKHGEADRHVFDLKPKHLFSGQRGQGKNQRR
jgi:nucleolar GTP-binding protein